MAHLGALSVGEISPATVRGWSTDLLNGGMSRNRAAKVYRLLRAIMNTAKDDELIRKNPCRIKGADEETESSRPVASVTQVYAVPRRFRALVFLGELGGRLRRSNFRRATHRGETVQQVRLTADFHDLRHTGNHLAAEATPRPQ